MAFHSASIFAMNSACDRGAGGKRSSGSVTAVSSPPDVSVSDSVSVRLARGSGDREPSSEAPTSVVAAVAAFESAFVAVFVTASDVAFRTTVVPFAFARHASVGGFGAGGGDRRGGRGALGGFGARGEGGGGDRAASHRAASASASA